MIGAVTSNKREEETSLVLDLLPAVDRCRNSAKWEIVFPREGFKWAVATRYLPDRKERGGVWLEDLVWSLQSRDINTVAGLLRFASAFEGNPLCSHSIIRACGNVCIIASVICID
jgi:hypothetical protein